MRKIYSLLALLFSTYFLQAQTTPSVNFTFTDSANYVKFTNTSLNLGDGTKKAFWIFGDGSWNVTGAYDGTVHHYAAAGTYQVCLRIYKYATNSNDSTLIGSECKSVTLQQPQATCTADFTWLVYGQIVRFAATGSTNQKILQICWNFGDGHDTCVTPTSSTILPVYHTYAQAGNYNVCVKINYDGGCSASKCNTVTIAPTTVPDSCYANYTVQPMASSPLGRRFVAVTWNNHQKKPVQVCWKFGDGTDTCIQYTTSYTGDYWVEHKYAQAGQYQVCVTVKYDGGCTSDRCNTVTLTAPTCEASINEVATNVSNLERRFYVGLQLNNAAEKVCWTFGDGTDTCITLTNPVNPQQLIITHRYASPGNYTACVKVTYTSGCIAERCKQVEIRVVNANVCGGYITDSVVSANTVNFKATGIVSSPDYVTSYNWTFGDGTGSDKQQVSHTYGSPGKYAVCLVMHTNLGCETRICKQTVIAGNAQPQLVLTPNPVVNNLYAVFQSMFQQSLTIKIYNANGLLMRTYTRSAVVGTNTWTFDVGSLPTGVYTVIVQSPNQFATAIFFKQ